MNADDARAVVGEIQQRTMNELLQAHDTFAKPAQALQGDELRRATRLFDGLSLVLDRVHELRQCSDAVEDILEHRPSDVDANTLRQEKTHLEAIAIIANASFVEHLSRTAHRHGFDPSPYFRAYEDPTPGNVANARALNLRLECIAEDGDSNEYQPASWFKKELGPRLRMAANPDRKTKRVKTRTVDGVTLYCVADARQWWSTDVP